MLPFSPLLLGAGVAIVAGVWLVQSLRKKWAKDINPYYGPQKITLTTGKTPQEIYRAKAAAERNQQMTIFIALVSIWLGIEYFFPEFAQRTRYAAAEFALAVVTATINFLEYTFNALTDYLAPKG